MGYHEEGAIEIAKLKSACNETAARADALEERIVDLERGAWDRAEYETNKRMFIRDAAVRIYTQGISAQAVTFSPATCWKAAREIWDAKPEDC